MRGAGPLKRRSLATLVLSAALFGWGTGAAVAAQPGALPSPPNLTPPVIQQAPSQIFYGRPFTIVTPDASRIVQVGLLSVGGGGKSVTLDILARTRDTLQVLAPSGPGVAPPGQYLLFIYAQGLGGGLIPSLPALLTLSAPPSPPGSTPPPSGHSSQPGGGKGSGGAGSGRSGGGGGKPGSGGSRSIAPGSSPTQPHAAVASPASAQHSVTTGAWLGVVLLIVFLATFFGLRRMLRT